MKLRSMAALIVSMNPKLQARQMDQPETIVREVLQAFEEGKRVVVPGKLKSGSALSARVCCPET